jgi:O-antigen/teichoic acid export membrane protein
MSEKRRIVINTLANGVAQFASMLSALVFMPFLIKGFGATGYGLYLIASSVAGYAGLLDLGVGTSVTKITAEASAQGDSERVGRVVSSGVAFYTLVGIVVAAIMLFLALNTGSFFKVTADGARLLRNLFLVTAAVSLWAWPSSTAGAVLAGYQRYKQSAMVSLATTIGTIVVTAAVVVMHEGPLTLMLGATGVSVATGIVSVVLAKRALGDTPLSPALADLRGLRSIFSVAWAVFVTQVCAVIVYQQTDRLVIGVFIGAAAVAAYEAAGKFQGLVSQLTNFTVSALMPMASHLDAQGRHETLRTLFLRGTKYSIALLNPVVVVLIVVAKPLLLVYVPMFAAQAFAAQLLISHQVLTSGTAVGDSIIIGLGKLPKRVPYAIGMALLNLTISLVLVQRLGILGVVLGTMIPYFIDYPFHIRILLRALDIPVSRWLKETVLPTYPLLLLPLLCSLLLIQTSLAGSLVGIALIGLVSVGAYWAAVYAFGLEPDERADVRVALSAVVARLRGDHA